MNAMNKIIQLVNFDLDPITRNAKINNCSLRWEKAIFLKNIINFSPNHGFGSLGKTELTYKDIGKCPRKWSIKPLILFLVFKNEHLKFGNAKKPFSPETAPKVKMLQIVRRYAKTSTFAWIHHERFGSFLEIQPKVVGVFEVKKYNIDINWSLWEKEERQNLVCSIVNFWVIFMWENLNNSMVKPRQQ